jgi:FkbM family methyltransferase
MKWLPQCSQKNRDRLIVLIFLLCVATAYAVLRGRDGKYADWIRVSTAWRILWIRVAMLPEPAEALLRDSGILSPVLQTVRLPFGVTMQLDPLDFVDRILIAHGAWEETEWKWIEQALKPGDTFVDVGAHHGAYSLRAALRVGASGLVLAVEPVPSTGERLKRNIALNQLRNIRVAEVACGEVPGTMTMYVAGRRNTGMSSLSRQTAQYAGSVGSVIKVSVETLDKLAGGLGGVRISAVKIDTEGAETFVLRGASETLRRHRPVVLVETIPSQLISMGSSLEELEALLVSYGYAKARATDSNALWVPADQVGR